jgi:hypothetical protein
LKIPIVAAGCSALDAEDDLEQIQCRHRWSCPNRLDKAPTLSAALRLHVRQ